MAFPTKCGVLMKHIVSQNVVTCMLNPVRHMSSQLFVGGLSFYTNNQSLEAAFSSFGDVTYVKVIMDRNTGKSKGYGFVSFAREGDATAALSAMDGQELNGRNIRVSVANERPLRSLGRGYVRRDPGFVEDDPS